MDSPYSVSVSQVADKYSLWSGAKDGGRFALLTLIFFLVTYGISLPYSSLLDKDIGLMVISPFIPIFFLATAIIGENGWATLVTFCLVPACVSGVAWVLGVRHTWAWIAVVAMGISFGLFLRLFYALCSIA